MGVAAAIVFLQRPTIVGELLALAGNWEALPWTDSSRGTPPPPGSHLPADPRLPLRPSVTARPASWPGEPEAEPSGEVEISDLEPASPRGPAARPVAPGWGPERVARPAADAPAPTGPSSPPRLSACRGPEVVATVGFDAILARDVSLGVPKMRADSAKWLEENQGKAPREMLEAEVNSAMAERIDEAMREQLKQKIETKILYLDAKRKAPPEGFEALKKFVAGKYESMALDNLVKQLGAKSRRELEEKIQEEWGITLEVHRQAFVETGVAQVWLREQIKPSQDVGHDELLRCYREHVKDFETPGRARWEHLMVRKSPNPSAAREKIAAMGNQVLDGVPLAEVARAQSQGPTAALGGQWDWTTQGNLRSEVLDKALFSPRLLPGQLSPILEDDEGFHILRVTERVDAACKPFYDAQNEIREKILKGRQEEAKAAFLAKLRKETPVRSAFLEEPAGRAPTARRLFN